MRRELAATLLISLYWIIAGFVVAYISWETGWAGGATAYSSYSSRLIGIPNPYLLGLILGIIGVIFTFIVARTLLPSRATQRRRLMRLLDEAGIEDVDVIQRKLGALNDEYEAENFDRVASLETLLSEEKRKNRAG